MHREGVGDLIVGLDRSVTAGPPRPSFGCPGTRAVTNQIRHLGFLATTAGFRRLCALTTVLDGDDRGTHIDRVALTHQELGHSAGVRTGQLNQRLAGLDLEKNVVDLDLITDRDPPGDDVGLNQPFARIQQPESLQRHSIPPKSVGQRTINHVEHPIKIRKVLLLDSARWIGRVKAGHP